MPINLTTRTGKGSKITTAEMDANLSSIQAAVNANETAIGGITGATNLNATPAASEVVVTSDTGNDATIPAATPTAAGVMSAADKTKLNGIATGATANATDAQLRDRSTHTGSQATSTITGLDAALAAKADLVGGVVPLSQLPAAVAGALNYQSAWNASTNSPAIPAAASGNKGWYYKVSTAGATSIDGITDWKVGDFLVSNGATWDKIDNTDPSASILTLAGLDTSSSSDVTGSDNVLSAFGKLQAKWNAIAATVRAVVLTGIDIATTGAVSAADSVMSALGKLEATKAPKANASFTGTFAAPAGTLTNTMLANMAASTVKGNLGGGAAAPSDLSVSALAAAMGVPNLSGGVSLTDPPPGIFGPRSFGDNQWTTIGIAGFSSLDSCTFGTPTSADGSFGNWFRARQNGAATGTGRLAGMQLSASSIKLRLDSTGSKRGRLPFKQTFALASSISTHALFVGIVKTTLSTYNGQPSAWSGDHVAVTADSTDTTLRVQWRDNAGTVSRVDLGANFPKSQHRPYTVMIDRDDDGSNLRVIVLDWTTGTTATVYVNSGALPSTTIDYGFQLFASSGTDATTVASIDMGLGTVGNFGYATSNKQDIALALGDRTTAITATGTNLNQWTAAYSGSVSDAFIELKTACSSGTFTVDIKKNGTSIFTTLLTIDATEQTSITAATPYAFNTPPITFVKGDVFSVDITVTGTGGVGPVAHLIVQPR